MITSLQTLSELKTTELRRDFPGVPDYAVPKYKYEDKTANGLTRCIIDYIRVTGNHAERINTTGRVIHSKGRSKYIPTTGTKGSADIHSIKSGRSIAIEVKIHDKQSDKQKQYQNAVEQSGGVYIIARTFDDFLEQWNAC